MMKLLTSLFLLSVTVACGSLRNEVDPSLLSMDGERLVVNGYISPQDTMLTVKVLRTKPLLGDQLHEIPFNVGNAAVLLAGESKAVALRYNADRQWYEAKASLLPIVTGKTYSLTVSMPDGRRVTAQTTVPAPVAIGRGNLDSTVVATGNRLQKFYRISFDWQDPANQANFYEYTAYYRWRPDTYPIDGQSVPLNTTLRLLLFARENQTGNLLTDARQDGSRMTSLSAEVGMVELALTTPDALAALKRLTLGKVLRGSQVLVQLLHTTELYYRHREAVIRQRETRSNPFAEPVLIPTNIVGGLGCFAAYNRSEQILNIR